MPKDERPWSEGRLMRAGVLKGRTFYSQKEYDEARATAKGHKENLRAATERAKKPVRARKGESMQSSVTRALEAIEPRTKAATAAHRAKTAATRKRAAAKKPAAKK